MIEEKKTIFNTYKTTILKLISASNQHQTEEELNQSKPIDIQQEMEDDANDRRTPSITLYQICRIDLSMIGFYLM